jgi:hypothetical protein
MFSAQSQAQSTLIHYWNFNSFYGVMYTDTIHGIDANYSIHDTTKAQILYAEMPGTSSSYTTYEDYVAAASGSPDFDTVNERFGDSSGNALRLRNPSDSMELLFYIPSIHYTHILLQYASQSSSITHGQLHQDFSYSVDSGLTWRTTGLSELSDSAWLTYHRTTVRIATDSSVKNNSKLVFRIIFSGNTTGTSGNNRIDNVTVEGDSIEAANVNITASPTGPICAGTSVHFSASATHPYVTPVYHWYINGSAAGTDSTGLTFSTLTDGSTVQCVITDSLDGSVVGSSNIITMSVTPAPNAGTITGSSNVCPTASITLSDAATGGTWSASNTHATITSAGVVTGVSTGIDTISYYVTNTCGSATATFAVNVSTTPSPGTISGGSTACIGVADTLSETISGGTWSTSNGNATVSSTGVVTGVTSGADTIIYSVATCGTSSTTFPVTVTAAPVPGTISGATSICKDSTTTLTETVTGGSWSSSNANASISLSGLLTGLNPGTDTITYTIIGACETVHTSQVVTVNTVINPGSISGSDTVCVGHSITLTPTVTGGIWGAGNAHATVSMTGVVMGITPGTDSIAYGFENACGISYALHTIVVSNTGSCTTGINTVNENTEAVTVYPNPSNGKFTLTCTSPYSEEVTVTISNMLGARVSQLSLNTNQITEVTINQPAGIYMVNTITSHGTYSTKIILAH